jgi:asparagine synthase (glutamine-hydrolysing)
MFAFAIWDARLGRLFLARDRFGKKPLFLCEDKDTLWFASEIKAILACSGTPRELDTEAVWEYFSYRYVPAPRTLLRGIQKLMPGCIAIWDQGRLHLQRYYLPPDGQPRAHRPSVKDPVKSFLEILGESVRLRMIADVPFGAFLSGGIDSSAIVGLMSNQSTQPVKTFSVGFRESKYSELAYARTIAEQFKTDHHELTVSQDDLIQHLPNLVRFRDAPVSEPSDIPIYMLAREARRSVKMVLTGEGSDEILGGYPKHVYERLVPAYQRIPAIMRNRILEPLVEALPYRFSRAKTAVLTLGIERFEERMPRWFGALNDRQRSELLDLPASITAQEAPQFALGKHNSALRQILYFDQVSWLPDNLLERGDRMTMAASLEARMPFMDHELAAFISSLPDNYRVRGTQTKWILRQAMMRLLPAAILERPKVGFRVPVNEWFQHSLREYLLEMLTGTEARCLSFMNRAALERVLREHVDGRINHEKLLWSMLSLEIWIRQTLDVAP